MSTMFIYGQRTKKWCLDYPAQLSSTPEQRQRHVAKVRLMKKLVALELVACCFTLEHTTHTNRNLYWGETDGY